VTLVKFLKIPDFQGGIFFFFTRVFVNMK
jgi:hypothetical protein